MEVIDVVIILFIACVAILLGAVIFGTVASNVEQTITDNDTLQSFQKVDAMGAQGFTLLGTVAPIIIVFLGFAVILGWWRLS